MNSEVNSEICYIICCIIDAEISVIGGDLNCQSGAFNTDDKEVVALCIYIYI